MKVVSLLLIWSFSLPQAGEQGDLSFQCASPAIGSRCPIPPIAVRQWPEQTPLRAILTESDLESMSESEEDSVDSEALGIDFNLLFDPQQAGLTVDSTQLGHHFTPPLRSPFLRC
jgi:hypothetical protein